MKHSKAVLNSRLSFQGAVLLYNARMVPSMHPTHTYRFPSNAVAVMGKDGHWYVYGPADAQKKRRLLSAGFQKGPSRAQGPSNSNILSAEEKLLQSRMKQMNEERSRSRLTPPEMEPNFTILVHGTVRQRQERMQLMRDTVRGHRPFSEAESLEFHTLRKFVEYVLTGHATEAEMQ